METEVKLPESLEEAILMFADKMYAHNVVAMFVWPDGQPTCRCGAKNAHFMEKYLRYRCRECRRDFTVKTGTIFEDSPLPLSKWLTAMWLIANCKNGVSSYELSRSLKLCQKTTWFMSQRIREAMKAGTLEKMSGEVECDETYVGGRNKFRHADKKTRGISGMAGKAIVAAVLERGEDKTSRVQTSRIKHADQPTMTKFIKDRVEPGSAVYTDAFSGYSKIKAEYVHLYVDHMKEYVRGAVHTNGLENFFSLLKRGLRGTYISVQPIHLERYVDEQAFRYNERKQTDAERFLKVLCQVTGRRLTWEKLTQNFEEFYGFFFQNC